MSATISVPQAVTARVPQGAAAATWIGAETLPDDAKAPFIQIGVQELPAGPSPKVSFYQAFWSDAAHGNQPLRLFTVHAGDRLSASLRLSHRHWTVAIVDGPVHRRIVTADEGTSRFQLALWSQEDIAYNHPKWMVYPRVTGTRFSDLLVNGRAPEGRYLGAEWMSADDELTPAGKTVVEPSAISRDTFTLLPGRAAVPASAIRLQGRLTRSYYATVKPLVALTDASVTTPRPKLAGWVSGLSKGLIAYESTLLRRHWPRNAQASVNALVSALRAQLSLTRAVAHLRASQFQRQQARLSASTPAVEIALARLQNALHLPWQS